MGVILWMHGGRIILAIAFCLCFVARMTSNWLVYLSRPENDREGRTFLQFVSESDG